MVGILSPDIFNICTGKVSLVQAVSYCKQNSDLCGTHGRSAGSEPNFSFTLLCTTKTANFVRCASRSGSESRRSSFSTSFWSSETAYLIHSCQMTREIQR